MFKKIVRVGAVAVIVGSAGVAVAPVTQTVGYLYGFRVCGPNKVNTARLCRVCCRKGLRTGALPPGQLANCYAACRRNRFPNLPWWVRFLT